MTYASIDANGTSHNVAVVEQASLTDRSSTIAATAVSQPLMPANAARSGWFVQNKSSHTITVSELGADATLAAAISIAAGQSFPPPGYPVPVGAINIAGTSGDAFAAREW